ncbi:hypothetical protein [Streptomyces lavendulae]|uniref:hypothetical protein n=1 Tax=Streptomyces lavendulae TaxID=1914 RepID=UPI00380D1021
MDPAGADGTGAWRRGAVHPSSQRILLRHAHLLVAQAVEAPGQLCQGAGPGSGRRTASPSGSSPSCGPPPHGQRNIADQKTIPYGAIRQTIAESERTREFTEALYADGPGCAQTYLQTGDADVPSLRTINGTPLFDEAAARTASGGWPDLFSGGYRLPACQDVRVDIATDLDRSVRVAMAKVGPETVCPPEPNTFIRLHEGVHGLEPGVTFGFHDQEGEALARSLAKVRGNGGRGISTPSGPWSPAVRGSSSGSGHCP